MAIALLIAFWVLLGLSVVFFAVRTTKRRRLQAPETRGGQGAFGFAVAALFIAFGLALPALSLVGASNAQESAPGGVDLTSAQLTGRQEFAHNCATCHTLAASKSAGQVGPNLDQLRPPKALVLNAVEQGRSRGNGQMPAKLLSGQDAENVADYVSAVAGH